MFAANLTVAETVGLGPKLKLLQAFQGSPKERAEAAPALSYRKRRQN